MIDDPRVLEGLRDIRARRFFEAHEALELAWREAQGEQRLTLQGLIQAAVALEHLRRGNPRGARGQWEKARAKLSGVPPVAEGVYVAEWVEALDRFYAAIGLDERSRRFVEKLPMEGLPPLPAEGLWPLPRYIAAVEAAISGPEPSPGAAEAPEPPGHARSGPPR